jgi:tetratricopeptide (TPR) repeat protein
MNLLIGLCVRHSFSVLCALGMILIHFPPIAAQSRVECPKPDCQLTPDEVWATVAQVNQGKQAFVVALRQLLVALAGTFGDEGTHQRSSIESLSVALDNWDRSILSLENQLRQSDSLAEFHIALGTVYLERSHLGEALREFVEAGRLAPLRADAHTFQALSSALLNRPEMAAQALAQAAALDPGKPALVYSRARQLALAGQSEQAGAVFRAFIESVPLESIDRYAGEAGGAPFERVALLRQVAGVAPIFPPALYAEAFKLLTQGEYREAVDRLKHLAVGDPLNEGWNGGDRLAQGSSALRNGDIHSAVAHLEVAVESAPNRAEAHRLLAVAYRENDQREESIKEFTTAVQLNPSDERARISLADALSAGGQYEAAERVLRAAVEILPSAGQAHYNLGRLYRLMARNLDAVQAFERAASLSPLVGIDHLYETIAAIHAVEAQAESAIEVLQKRVEVSPNNAEAHRKLGEALLQHNRSDEALAEFLVALLIDPKSAQTYAGIGQLHLQRGRYVDAAAASRRAVALDPANRGARYSLGAALLRLGQTSEGEKEILEFERLQAEARIREEREWELRLIRQAASASLDKGDYAKVAQYLRQAIIYSPDDASAHISLGVVLKRLGQHAEAIESFLKALELKAGGDVHRLLAESYQALGRLADSQRHRDIYTRSKEQRLRTLGESR